MWRRQEESHVKQDVGIACKGLLAWLTKSYNLFHKALSKAHIPLIIKPGEKGFEPLTFGFGNHYSTVEAILLTFGANLKRIVASKARANLYLNLVYGRTRTTALVQVQIYCFAYCAYPLKPSYGPVLLVLLRTVDQR